MKQIINLINKIYIIFISIFLYVFLKPLITISKKILNYKIHEKISFFLIDFVNLFYIAERLEAIKMNNIKYNIRKYRDVYDKKGLNLYFHHFNPEDIINNKKILDIGCGVGGKDYELLKFNPKKIVGIDLSKRNIKYAKELINPKTKDKLCFLNKNLMDFDEKTKFDTIISYAVFEHIDKNLLIPVLNKSYNLLNKKGKMLIVFNHYNDKFGMHLQEYIYHPWPQSIFDEQTLFNYWNYTLKKDKNINSESYFPIEYKHGAYKHNSDCFMNLNRISIEEFEKIISKTRFKYIKKDLYSKSFLLKIFPFIPEKYLIGSSVYYLTVPSFHSIEH